MRPFIFIALTLLFYTIPARAQEEGAREQSIKRAEEIIQLARQAVYKDIQILDVKTLFINVKGKYTSLIKTPLDGEREMQIESTGLEESTFSIQKPDKIRIYSLEKTGEDSGTRKIQILNGEKTYANWETMDNGEFVDFNVQFKKIGSPGIPYKDAVNKDFFIQSTWTDIFPIVLYNFLDESAKYLYFGKAEAPTGRADIIILKRSNTLLETKLFFDEKSHLLLMIVTTYQNDKQKTKNSYYYSNYILKDGMLIPQSIKVETSYITRQKLGIETVNKQKEFEVFDFKLNPKFDAKEFEIKEEKKSEAKTKQ